MSQKERARLVVMVQVKQKKLSLVQASAVLGLSYRQGKRLWRRYRRQGDAGLVHRLRGRPSSRRLSPTFRQEVLARYRQQYGDFGPTLAAEYLAKEGWKVDHETLRRWLLQEGLWQKRRRRGAHRQWRERKACWGQMVQLDGSQHDWFEGRRERAVLMVMIDDATNRVCARFSEEETTAASYDLLADWLRCYGVPRSLYVDRDSIYRCERKATLAEELAAAAPQTQFGRAMKQLGVELILANSPQAKGRVERCNGLMQDRLVKALRLEGINDLARANEFLQSRFLPELNARFVLPAATAADVHQKVPAQLSEILSWEYVRQVQRDWTFVWEGQWYQINRRHEGLSLAGRQILLRRLRDGSEQVLYRGQKLSWRKLPARPQRARPGSIGLVEPRKSSVPEAKHPWRRMGVAVGRRFWNEIQQRGQAVGQAQAAGLQSASATLRPPSIPPPKNEQLSRRGHSLVS
jgi:transposase